MFSASDGILSAITVHALSVFHSGMQVIPAIAQSDLSLMNWMSRWADATSFIGLILTIVGFTITLVGVRRSQTAAEAAAASAARIREVLLRSTAIEDIASAVTTMEEIKRLHRAGAWARLPDRYSALRVRLIRIRTRTPGLTEDETSVLTGAIQQFSTMERQVEVALTQGGIPANAPRLNMLVSKQLDRLVELLNDVTKYDGARNG